MYCKYCGKKIDVDQDLCLNCGRYINKNEIIKKVEEDKEYIEDKHIDTPNVKRNNKLVLVISIIGILLFIVLIIISLQKVGVFDKEKKASNVLIKSIERFPSSFPYGPRVVEGNITNNVYYLRIVGYKNNSYVDNCYKIRKDSSFEILNNNYYCENSSLNNKLDINKLNNYIDEALLDIYDVGPFY